MAYNTKCTLVAQSDVFGSVIGMLSSEGSIAQESFINPIYYKTTCSLISCDSMSHVGIRVKSENLILQRAVGLVHTTI